MAGYLVDKDFWQIMIKGMDARSVVRAFSASRSQGHQFLLECKGEVS
jgi:hypothetical protein